jgi:hypothetical protein
MRNAGIAILAAEKRAGRPRSGPDQCGSCVCIGARESVRDRPFVRIEVSAPTGTAGVPPAPVQGRGREAGGPADCPN